MGGIKSFVKKLRMYFKARDPEREWEIIRFSRPYVMIAEALYAAGQERLLQNQKLTMLLVHAIYAFEDEVREEERERQWTYQEDANGNLVGKDKNGATHKVMQKNEFG